METAIRFHVDENVHFGVISGLRAAGCDVTAAIELSLRGATDLQQIEFAISTNRVLVRTISTFRHITSLAAITLA